MVDSIASQAPRRIPKNWLINSQMLLRVCLSFSRARFFLIIDWETKSIFRVVLTRKKEKEEKDEITSKEDEKKWIFCLTRRWFLRDFEHFFRVPLAPREKMFHINFEYNKEVAASYWFSLSSVCYFFCSHDIMFDLLLSRFSGLTESFLSHFN